jgi:hypothetical protein
VPQTDSSIGQKPCFPSYPRLRHPDGYRIELVQRSDLTGEAGSGGS